MIGHPLDRLLLPLWNLFERLQPLSDSVALGVDACRLAAVDVAGIGPDEVSILPTVPSSGQPDWDRALAIDELYAFHGLVWDTPSTIKCTGCRHVSHSERRHWRHVTELVTDMVTTDYRIQQLLNK